MERSLAGHWIIDPAFKGLTPLDVYHKELDPWEGQDHPEDLKNRHILIRRTFELESLQGQSKLLISADDYYKVYVNGYLIGQGPAPAYPGSYYYNTYDLSQVLVAGKNVIAVHLYYQGLINRVWNSGDLRMGLWAAVYQDSQCVLSTDDRWRYQVSKAFKGPRITGYDTQYLEDFDSNLWKSDWYDLAFVDKDWDRMVINEEDDHVLRPQPTESLQVYEQAPDTIQALGHGHWLIDFGQEITAGLTMKARGQKNQLVEIRCGEELEDGRVRYAMRCNCDYQEYWTLSGQEDWLNQYDYKAFRYVEVIDASASVDIETLRAMVRHYPLDDQAFNLTTSDPMLNRIIEVCSNGVKYGSQEGYLDCPSREKGQYLGDFTITGHSHLYLSGTSDLYKKTLEEFAASKAICPGIMAVVPGSFMQEIGDFSMQWPLQLYHYYEHTGDRGFLEEMLPTIEGLEAYFKKYEREDGLITELTDKWNLVDWPVGSRDGYDFPLTKPVGEGCHNVINAFYYGMLTYADKVRNALGMECLHNLQAYKASFLKAFYQEDLDLFVDSEGSDHSSVHANALPMYFDLFPKQVSEKTRQFVYERADRCGVYMAYFLLGGLAKTGRDAKVFDLLIDLWTPMVEEGATTCFEAWTKDHKKNTSLCHPWASSPIPILVEEIMGIRAAKPGWSEVIFDPNIPAHIEAISFRVTLPTGPLEIVKKGDNLTITGKNTIKITPIKDNTRILHL